MVGLHRVFCQEAAPPPLDGAARAALAEQIRALRARPRRAPDAVARAGGAARACTSRRTPAPGVLDGAVARRPDAPRAPARARQLRAAHRDRRARGARRAVPRSVLALPRDPRAGAAPAGRAGGARALLPRRLDRLRRAAGGGLEPPHRPSADGHRARHLRARARHGAGARRLDPRPAAATTMPGGGDLGAAGVAAAAALVAFFRTLSRLAYVRPSASSRCPTSTAASRSPTARPPRRSRSSRTASSSGRGRRRRGRPRDRRRGGRRPGRRRPSAAPMRVGFVGRVVPIKDVITFIKACDLALRVVDLDVRIIGPTDEDPGYAARCRELVDAARARAADPVRRADAAGAHLRRSGRRRADQLQRGAAAGDPRGLRLRRSRWSPPTSAPAAR